MTELSAILEKSLESWINDHFPDGIKPDDVLDLDDYEGPIILLASILGNMREQTAWLARMAHVLLTAHDPEYQKSTSNQA